jgi:O-antigen/teichoic acid export membrane protein
MFEQITQVGKHSLVYSAGVLLQRVTTFILLPVYTLYFSTSDFGQMDLLNTTSTLLSAFLALGMIAGMFRIYYKAEDESQRLNIAKTALLLFTATSSLLIIFIIFAKPLSNLLFGSANQNYLVILVLISIILGNILLVPFSLLRARGQSLRYVAFYLIQFFVNIGFTIYLVVVAGHGIAGNFEGQVIGQLAVFLLFTGVFLNIIRGRYTRESAREILSFGLPLMPATLAMISLTIADRYFLRVYSTFDQIGIYGLGYNFGMIVSVLVVTPFMLSWGPTMWSVSDKPFAKQFYARVLTYFTLVALFVALAISILSPEIIRIMSRSSAFWVAWKVVPLISISYVFYGLYFLTNVGIYLKKKPAYIPLIVGSVAVINLALNFILIPDWGIMGAAVATLISYFLLVVFSYVVSQRSYRIVYEWVRLIKAAVLFIILLVSGLLVSSDSIYLTLIMKVGLILLFPAILILMRFFTPDELKRGRELIAGIWNTTWKPFQERGNKGKQD